MSCFTKTFQIGLRTYIQGSESEWQDSVLWTLTLPPEIKGHACVPLRLPLPRVAGSWQRLPSNLAPSNSKVLFSTFGHDELLWVSFSRQETKASVFYYINININLISNYLQGDLFKGTVRIQRVADLTFTPTMLMGLSNLIKTFGSFKPPIHSSKLINNAEEKPFIWLFSFSNLDLTTSSISVRYHISLIIGKLRLIWCEFSISL